MSIWQPPSWSGSTGGIRRCAHDGAMRKPQIDVQRSPVEHMLAYLEIGQAIDGRGLTVGRELYDGAGREPQRPAALADAVGHIDLARDLRIAPQGRNQLSSSIGCGLAADARQILPDPFRDVCEHTARHIYERMPP